MKLPEIVTEWLAKAEEDYGFACASLEDTTYFAQICFHFQQAAEKYLKAFIVANKLDFRAVHNLIELLDICSRQKPDIEQLRQAVIYLNPFYIESRYPVNWPVHYEKNTALKAKQMAEQVGNWVINSLGSEK